MTTAKRRKRDGGKTNVVRPQDNGNSQPSEISNIENDRDFANDRIVHNEDSESVEPIEGCEDDIPVRATAIVEFDGQGIASPVAWRAGLDSSTLERAEQLNAEARKHAEDSELYARRSVESLYQMGKVCAEMADLIPNRNYLRWLKEFSELSQPTLYAWRSVAELMPSLESSQLENFVPSALRQLGTKSLPDEVREEAIALATQGSTVDMNTVRELRERVGSSQFENNEPDEELPYQHKDRDVGVVDESPAIEPSRQKLERVANDYYPTPDELFQALVDRVDFKGQVLDPCCAHGTLTKFFYGCITNEPYPTEDFEPDYQCDASQVAFWEAVDADGGFDWMITNPPYDIEVLMDIIQNAFEHARVGIAVLLRLSFLEPCSDRAVWLQENRDHLVHVFPVNPRPAFRKDTNGSDQIAPAWYVFNKTWSWEESGIPCPFDFITGWKHNTKFQPQLTKSPF